MAVISYLEIEPLKLDLQTKKILKKFKSSLSYNLKYTKKMKESRDLDRRPAQNISKNPRKKKKKKPRTYQRT